MEEWGGGTEGWMSSSSSSSSSDGLSCVHERKVRGGDFGFWVDDLMI